MSTMFCPQCRAEYREGVTVCSDCGVVLIDDLPRPERRHHTYPTQPDKPFAAGDDVVELTVGSRTDAELIAAQLRAGDIPAAVFDAAVYVSMYTGIQRGRVMVRRSDLDAATAFLRDRAGDAFRPEPISDAELAAQAESAVGGTDPESGVV